MTKCHLCVTNDTVKTGIFYDRKREFWLSYDRKREFWPFGQQIVIVIRKLKNPEEVCWASLQKWGCVTQAVKARPIPPWSGLKWAGSVNVNTAKFVTVKIGLDVHIKCQKSVRATMYSDFKSQICTKLKRHTCLLISGRPNLFYIYQCLYYWRRFTLIFRIVPYSMAV